MKLLQTEATKSAREAVKNEDQGKAHHDVIHAQAPAQDLVQDLCSAFEDAGDVDDKEDEGEYRIKSAQGRAEAVFHHLGRGGAPHAPEHGRHDPVKGQGKQVLPLVPDGGDAHAVDGARQAHRHLGVVPTPNVWATISILPKRLLPRKYWPVVFTPRLATIPTAIRETR